MENQKEETEKNGHFYQNSCHTDLAVEMKEEVEQKQELTGVEVSTKKHAYHGITETRIRIVDERGEAALGKPVGNYVTLEVEKLYRDSVQKRIARIICDVIAQLSQGAQNILVAGLGNRSVTPDAIGPKVMEHLQITRHLFECGYVKSDALNMKVVSAIAPGVMAQTGMETVEILRGIIEKTHPQAVIVVDALAARSSNRLNRTIQLCDTGISPGAGVGNNRQKMNEETLGVKVVAIGVPTVIAVPTIISDAMQQLLLLLGADHAGKLVEELSYEEQYQLAEELVKPYFTDMFVTPKNIDEEILMMSQCIAQGINAYINI
ncbi:MAG: GPR endopeptidase [Lachnospiraceae bacterium]|nr:GPR endopeptidase [Lachnospiraceae bacterium]